MIDKNHGFSKQAQKTDKNQCLFMTKALNKLRVEGTCLKVVKVIYGTPTANTIFNGEILKSLPPRSGTRQKGAHLHHYYST